MSKSTVFETSISVLPENLISIWRTSKFKKSTRKALIYYAHIKHTFWSRVTAPSHWVSHEPDAAQLVKVFALRQHCTQRVTGLISWADHLVVFVKPASTSLPRAVNVIKQLTLKPFFRTSIVSNDLMRLAFKLSEKKTFRGKNHAIETFSNPRWLNMYYWLVLLLGLPILWIRSCEMDPLKFSLGIFSVLYYNEFTNRTPMVCHRKV